jgi:hypothetical protein
MTEAKNDTSSRSDLALALFSILPSSYNQSTLVAIKSVNTALGVQVERDYALRFSQSDDNAVRLLQPTWLPLGGGGGVSVRCGYGCGCGSYCCGAVDGRPGELR